MMSIEYPIRILPQKGYITQMGRDVLTSVNPWLQRKSYRPIEECCIDGDINRITPKAFGDVGLTRMSVNIIGGLYWISDEIWHQSMHEEDNWDGEKVIALEDFRGRYNMEDKPITPIYFTFEDANSLNWTFPRIFQNAAQHDKYKDAIVEGLDGFQKDLTYTLKAYSECLHVATDLNYWHAEIRSVIDSLPPEEIRKMKASYQKQAIHGMIEKLRVKSSLNAPSNIPQFHKDSYMRK